MSGDDTVEAYVNQVKQGWTQLSSGIVDQVKKHTGTGGDDEGVNILPAGLMSMSSAEPASRPPKSVASHHTKHNIPAGILPVEAAAPAEKKTEQTPVRSQKESADDPLGLGSEVLPPKGKRITKANTEYVEKVAEAQKLVTGGAEASADDPLGLGK